MFRVDGQIAGFAPAYLKTHSMGEYVFDWAWADAYQRHGLNYYPKLLIAIPFTPPRVRACCSIPCFETDLGRADFGICWTR